MGFVVLQVLLGLVPQTLGQPVRDVGRLVYPAALFAGGAVDVAERFPEPEGAVTGHQLRTSAKASPLEIEPHNRDINLLGAPPQSIDIRRPTHRRRLHPCRSFGDFPRWP